MIRRLINRVLSMFAFIMPGGYSIRPWLHRLRGVKVGKNVWISQYVYVDDLHPEAITIEDNCTIGLRTTIFSHLYWGGRRDAVSPGQIFIERDVYIGPHCVILPNVRIGEGSVIKAGTVVTRNVPPRTLYGLRSPEVLGKVTVPLTHRHTYEKFIAGLRPVRKGRDGEQGQL